MSNIMIDFSIFDSGLSFSPLADNTRTIKSALFNSQIAVEAAIGYASGVALLFGTNNFQGNSNNIANNKYYFGFDKENVSSNDTISLSNTAFLGFFEVNRPSSFIENQFSTICVPASFDLSTSHTIDTKVNIAGDLQMDHLLDIVHDIENNMLTGTLDDTDKNIIKVLYRTFLQADDNPRGIPYTTGPAFIPLCCGRYTHNLISCLNSDSYSFFEKMSDVADKANMALSDFRLYILLMTLYSDDSPLADSMSTIQSISLT